MPFSQFFKIIFCALIIEGILLICGILMGKVYFITIGYSVLINIITSINDVIRPKKMGLVAIPIKGIKLMDLLYICSSFIPIFNIVFSIIRYHYSICTIDEKFIENYPGKIITPKEAIKEYNPENKKEPLFYVPLVKKEEDLKIEYENISKKKYNFSKQMESINSYMDYILLNKNLNQKQKTKLLKELKNSVVYHNQVKLSNNKIKRLQKCK